MVELLLLIEANLGELIAVQLKQLPFSNWKRMNQPTQAHKHFVLEWTRLTSQHECSHWEFVYLHCLCQ